MGSGLARVLIGVGDLLLRDTEIVHGLGQLFIGHLFGVDAGGLLDLLSL